jgi:p-aminobenzoyl-glutamate transporter AbgT
MSKDSSNNSNGVNLDDTSFSAGEKVKGGDSLSRAQKVDGYRNTANSAVKDGKWKFILIMVIALIATISSGVSFFTAKYRLKKEGQETEVDNISNSSGLVFVMSLLLVFFTAFFVFAKL